VDERQYKKALSTYEDRRKLLLKRVEAEKQDPSKSALSVQIVLQNGSTKTVAARKFNTVRNICRQLGVDSFTFAGLTAHSRGSNSTSSLGSLGVCDGAQLHIDSQTLPVGFKGVFASEAEIELASYDDPPEKEDYMNTYEDTICCGCTVSRVYDPFYRSAKLMKMDTNNDGVIDAREFAASGGSKAAFERLDLNQDGVLDTYEVSIADQNTTAVAMAPAPPKGLQM
jgi:hypothetical protein